MTQSWQDLDLKTAVTERSVGNFIVAYKVQSLAYVIIQLSSPIHISTEKIRKVVPRYYLEEQQNESVSRNYKNHLQQHTVVYLIKFF